MSPSIELDSFTFTHAGAKVAALTNVTAAIQGGQIIAIMGHAGAGKSTLCMCTNGTIPHFFKGALQGSITVDGKDTSDMKMRDLSGIVALVFQDFESQLISSSVEQEIAFGPGNFGLPKAELRRRVETYLPIVGAPALRHVSPWRLSIGQRQLLTIASGFAMEPKVLILDEATTDLDALNRSKVILAARRIADAGGLVVLVEHDPEIALNADSILLLNHGRVVGHGPCAEILADTLLLESAGCRPPDLKDLFGKLGIPEFPLTVEDAAISIREKFAVVVQRHVPPLLVEPQSPLLQAKSVSYRYPGLDTEAVVSIDLDLRRGELTCLIGPNASGKSSLGKLLSGILAPTTGSITYDGKDLQLVPGADRARNIGYIFQNPASQLSCRTVYEELTCRLTDSYSSEEELAHRLAEVVDALELRGYESLDPFTLTKGQQQRVAIASVLIYGPSLIVLDEPTTGLDHGQQVKMMRLLQRLASNGRAILVITHNMWIVTHYAARTVVFEAGHVVLDGTTTDVLFDDRLPTSIGVDLPPIVRLSRMLELSALTVDEMIDSVEFVKS